jgi:hypothetical protein
LVIASHADLGNYEIQGFRRHIKRIAEHHYHDCIAIRFAPHDGITVGAKPVAYSEEYFNVA